jgi:hypothetical protein
VALAASLAVGAPAQGQTINTATGWNTAPEWGGPWGNPDTPSVGQTFVVPVNRPAYFANATFHLAYRSGGALSYQMLLYQWNGSGITGNALVASPVLTTPTTTDPYVIPIRLSMNGVRLLPNTPYILLLTTTTSGNQASGLYRVGRVTGDRYPDGAFLLNPTNSLVSGWAPPNQGADRDMAFIFVFGPDPANTQLGLQSTIGPVRSVLGQRAAATTFALDYDCPVFDAQGVCVSVGLRNGQIGGYGDSGESAGLLALGYRVTPEFRLGGFIDQSLVSNTPVGVETKATQPMLGAFAVYQQNPDFTGLTLRGAVAYQEGELRITRPELPDAEAGTGRARTSALAFGAELAYGVALDSSWVAQPYAGLRRSESTRWGYTETASDAVAFPISYRSFGQAVTSATAGLRLRGAITPQFGVVLGAGLEHDLDSKIDAYAGTSEVGGLESFSMSVAQQHNGTRAVGSAAMRYMIAPNQAVSVDTAVRQMPYGNDPAITTMIRYSIGF